jgi:hypothetical protein
VEILGGGRRRQITQTQTVAKECGSHGLFCLLAGGDLKNVALKNWRVIDPLTTSHGWIFLSIRQDTPESARD